MFIKPICLPYDADQKNDYQKFEEPVYVAGWGVTGPRSMFNFTITKFMFIYRDINKFMQDSMFEKIVFFSFQKERLEAPLKVAPSLMHCNT